MKKLDELDYYELLNINPNATQEEIEKAYLYGVASFHPDSLASYGLLTEEEKKAALEKIEEAYQTLSNPSKRKKYNLRLRELRNRYEERIHFRQSFTKLEIEDGESHAKRIGRRLCNLFFRSKMKKETQPGEKAKTREADEYSVDNLAFCSGEYLRKVRETKGISLEEISRKSKLNVSLLKALEEENYEELPQGTYLPHVVKIYAQYLGLNLGLKTPQG
ncbi:MAG: helix-turn-helix domain-containing protein [Candidatus Aminicenantales bacterium]